MGSIFFNRKRDLGIPDIERIVLHDAEILSFEELDGDTVQMKVDDGIGQLQLLTFTGVSRIENDIRSKTIAITIQQPDSYGIMLAGADCERIETGYRTMFLDFFDKQTILLIEHTGFEVECLGEIAG